LPDGREHAGGTARRDVLEDCDLDALLRPLTAHRLMNFR
jgi:hypothetical protein